MRSARLAVFASVVAILLAATGGGVNADPGDEHGGNHSGPPELPPFEGPASHNMTLVGNSDKEATVNTDLAFWGDLAFAGNYNGFRILDISDPARPETLSDYYCRGPQNDVSVYQAGSRLLLSRASTGRRPRNPVTAQSKGPAGTPRSSRTPPAATGPHSVSKAFGSST